MAEIYRAVDGQNARRFGEDYYFFAAGMNNTMYRRREMWPTIAPRKSTIICGTGWCRQVHDENAFASRVSGHAGLFMHRRRIWRPLPGAANGGVYAHQKILRRATDRAIHDAAAALRGTRTLGWAVPTEGGVERPLFFGAQLWTHRIYGLRLD